MKNDTIRVYRKQGQWNIEYHLVQNTIAKTTDLPQFKKNNEETAFVNPNNNNNNITEQKWLAYSIKKYRNTEETTIVYTFTKNESGSNFKIRRCQLYKTLKLFMNSPIKQTSSHISNISRKFYEKPKC